MLVFLGVKSAENRKWRDGSYISGRELVQSVKRVPCKHEFWTSDPAPTQMPDSREYNKSNSLPTSGFPTCVSTRIFTHRTQELCHFKGNGTQLGCTGKGTRSLCLPDRWPTTEGHPSLGLASICPSGPWRNLGKSVNICIFPHRKRVFCFVFTQIWETMEKQKNKEVLLQNILNKYKNRCNTILAWHVPVTRTAKAKW